jgi:hypothetical protein
MRDAPVSSNARRDFVKRAVSLALLGAGGFCAPTLYAQAATGIATQIATSIASSFGKQAATLAFGQIMGAIGIDTSGTAAIQQALNQILGDLDALKSELDTVLQKIEIGFSKAAYTAAKTAALDLIARNRHLVEAMKVLVALNPTPQDTPQQRADKLTAIATQKDHIYSLFDPFYFAALEKWNLLIQGGVGDDISLIKTWSALSYATATNYYGKEQAIGMQNLWDYIDAQQALTVSFLVDYYTSHTPTNPAQAQATLATWYRYRVQQLGLLRGQARRSDNFSESGGSGTIKQRTTALPNCLPLNTIVMKPLNDIVSDSTVAMWLLDLYGPIGESAAACSDEDITNGTYSAVQAAISKTGRGSSGLYGRWGRPTNFAFKALCNTLGGSVGNGGPDTFANAMSGAGFVFKPGSPTRIWSGEGVFQGGRAGVRSDIWVDGSTWSHDPPIPKSPACTWPDGQRSAMILLARNALPSQGEYYWWSL